MEITESELSAQYQRAKSTWPFIHHTELARGLPRTLLFAVGSRETNLTNEVGDFGHGHGVWQLDDRSHSASVKSIRFVSAFIAMAAVVLLAGCSSGTHAVSGSRDTYASPAASTPTTSAPSETLETSTPSASESSSDAPPATVDNNAGALGAPTGRRTLQGLQGANAAPSQVNTAAGTLQEATQNTSWASDWCRYTWTGSGWQGDVCLRAHTDNGQVVSNMYDLYLYDLTAVGHLGQQIIQMDMAYPEYVIVRDLRDRVFQWVHWIAWPVGTTPTSNTLLFQVTRSDGQEVWLTYRQLMAALTAGNDSQYVTVDGGDQQLTGMSPDAAAWFINLSTNLNRALIQPWTAPACEGSPDGCGR